MCTDYCPFQVLLSLDGVQTCKRNDLGPLSPAEDLSLSTRINQGSDVARPGRRGLPQVWDADAVAGLGYMHGSQYVLVDLLQQ